MEDCIITNSPNSMENSFPTLDAKELADYFGFIETDSIVDEVVDDRKDDEVIIFLK